MTRIVGTVRLALAFATLSAIASAQVWSTVPFGLFCGYPYGATTEPEFSGNTGGQQYYERLTRDPDVPFPSDGSPCLGPGLEAELLRHLSGAADWLEGVGFPDPTPVRLGPRLPPHLTPTLAVRVYLYDRPYDRRDTDDAVEVLGTADQSCGPGAMGLAFVRFAPSEVPVASAIEGGIPSLVAHELAHVVQDATALFRSRVVCDEGTVGAVPEWVVEGTADAFGIG